MNLIALTGPKGSGKTTLARNLCRSHGYEIWSFAAPIKVMLKTLLQYRGVSNRHIERMLKKDLKETPDYLFGGNSPRHAMQTLGTEWGRELLHPNYWVDTWIDAITIRKIERVVVDDLRFPNEAEAVRRLGGKIVRIMRWEAPAGLDPHASEQSLNSIVPDHIIANHEGSSDEMLLKLKEVLNEFDWESQKPIDLSPRGLRVGPQEPPKAL